MDVLELAYFGPQEGWKHLYRMANWNGNGHELPSETIEYFVSLSKALLSEREQLKSENRNTYNSQIRDVAIKHLDLTKPTSGRTSLDDKSYAEFFQSKTYEHAAAVFAKLTNNPLLTESEAIEQVAEESDTRLNGTRSVSANTVRRAWKYTKKHPTSGIETWLLSWTREQAQKQYLAEKITDYSNSKARFRGLKFNTKIPHSVLRFTSSKTANIEIEIATFSPTGVLKGSEQFLNEDGIHDSHECYVEVLAQCIQIDGEIYNAEKWSGIMAPLLIFIGEQTVAKLERREPRKHWP